MHLIPSEDPPVGKDVKVEDSNNYEHDPAQAYTKLCVSVLDFNKNILKVKIKNNR